jgi:hypothetical protein
MVLIDGSIIYGERERDAKRDDNEKSATMLKGFNVKLMQKINQ